MADDDKTVSTESSFSKKGRGRNFYCLMEPCFEVDVCFSSQKGLNMHHKEVHQMRFACGFCHCSSHFSSFAVLKKHKLIHNLTKRRYPCSGCKKSFLFRSELALHERLHSQVKPYKCQQCPAEYKLKSDLSQHVSVKHGTGEQVSCLYPDCDYSTTSKRNLYKHVRGKHKKCMYSCPKRGCDFESSYRLGVHYHLLSFHGQKRKVKLRNKLKV